MAKVDPNSLLAGLRGNLGGIVLKRYGDRVIASKYPDMSGVRRTVAQKAQLERMRLASRYYQLLKADRSLLEHYTKAAARRKTTVHRLATKDFMRHAGSSSRPDLVGELLALKRAELKAGDSRRGGAG